MKADDPRSLDDLVGRRVELRTNPDFGWRGEGYARVGDGWISVPAALPREVVAVEVEDEIGRGRRAFGRLVTVRKPAAERVDSHCSRVAICRGCQLRTASPNLESDFKRERISELLQKFGELDPADLPAIGRIGCSNERSKGYRWRTNLTFRGEGRQLGLVSGAVDHLIPMSDCPSLTREARRLVAAVEETVRLPELDVLGPEAGGRGLRSIRIEAGTPARIVVVPASPNPRSSEVFGPLGEALHARLPGADIAVELDYGFAVLHGDAWMKVPYRVGSEPLEARIGSWTHATTTPPERLYQYVSDRLATLGTTRHLDVGCAIGAISLVAAQLGAEVVGIDRSEDATTSARRNLARMPTPSSFVTADWEKGLRDLLVAGARFDSATINPMREPVGPRALSYLDQLGIDHVIYLGPSPEASSRDFAQMRRLGWRVDRLHAVDLHPASYQVMVSAEFGRA